MRDTDAPNRAWSSFDEDPIPVVFGRDVRLAALYRFITCRPMDGRARTNATFWKAGTKAHTNSGHVMAYQFWPGWKRGLWMTRVPPLLGFFTVIHLARGSHGILIFWLPFLVFYGRGWVAYAWNYRHNRHVVQPITAAAANILRTREVSLVLPREMVRNERTSAVGILWLPMDWSGADGDRDRLIDMLQDRVGSPLAADWQMGGRRPRAVLTVPIQPPKLVPWSRAITMADPDDPYLGESAAGPVNWDLSEDSPHIAIVDGTGGGKSELTAWIVAQFMRGGAGVVVLDPKMGSHYWLNAIPEVLYCTTGATLTSTILWLDEELLRRGAMNLKANRDLDWPKIVVVMEERNSLKTILRDHWIATKDKGQGMTPPAAAALDRLAAMGRSLNITVILVAQETAVQHIGSRSNFGTWAMGSRLAAGHWRNVMGPGAHKPAISPRPGRFGHVVGDRAVVFQAAFPDLKKNPGRLIEWATDGEPPLDVRRLMMDMPCAHSPSSDDHHQSSSSPDDTAEYVTLSGYAQFRSWPRSRMDNAKRKAGFPAEVGKRSGAAMFLRDDLDAWFGGER